MGGSGGAGGYFELYNVGLNPIPAANYNCIVRGGGAGSNGIPGAGGDGGQGGDGGDGSHFCHGGSAGAQGPSGDQGGIPNVVPAAGLDGLIIVKNLTLIEMLNSSSKQPVNDQP